MSPHRVAHNNHKELAIAARPKTLDEVIGQDKKVKLIRRLMKRRPPNVWLLAGGSGNGKTTIARIIALSLQCSHQKIFGNPCIKCRRKRKKFPIYEMDCGVNRGVEQVEQRIAMSEYVILGDGLRKVFIFDEVHMLSKHAQTALMKAMEEDDNNSVWIMCTTDPQLLKKPLVTRSQLVTLRPFDRESMTLLVKKLLRKVGRKALSAIDLVDALIDNGVSSGRLICKAVDRYATGEPAEEAAEVDLDTDVRAKSVIRAVVSGDWEATAALLRKNGKDNIRQLRGAIVGYLMVPLLDSTEYDGRSKAIARSIKNLAYVSSAEESNQLGALAAELFTLCHTFSRYRL